VTAVVTSDRWTTDSPPAVANDALRAIDVTVTEIATGRKYRTGTYRVRSGI
jgi:hypothetical protein